MPTIDQIYRDNLVLLKKEAGGVTNLAKAIEKSPAQVSQWLNGSPDSKTGKPRALSRDMARYIEGKCGKEEGWMDRSHGEAHATLALPAEGADQDAVFHALAPEQMELLAEWKDIPPWKRQALLDRIREAAAQSRDEKAYYLADDGSKKNTLTADLKMQPTSSRSKSAVNHGDGNPKQTALPLATAANPFDPDSAPANEKAWYRQLALKPKASDE